MPPRLKPSLRSMVSLASAHRLALQPLPSSGDPEHLGVVGVREVRRSVRTDRNVVEEDVGPGCTERREQGALGAVDPEVRAPGAVAVGASGDVDAALLVHRDTARGEATVGAVAAEPLGRRGRADRSAVDLTAGHLADVEQSAPLVGADALELRADRAVGVAREQVGRGATVVAVRKGRCGAERGTDGDEQGAGDQGGALHGSHSSAGVRVDGSMVLEAAGLGRRAVGQSSIADRLMPSASGFPTLVRP